MVRTNSRVTLNGVKYRVYVYPTDPKILEEHVPAHPNYSPEYFPHKEEGVVIKGRSWTIN